MIFALGFFSYLFALFAMAVLQRMGRFEANVHRWSDAVVLVPAVGGMLAMMWSAGVVVARFLP